MSAKKGKDALLLWCQRATEGYKGVNITNFHTSWADGLGFCAIIHKFRPDKIDFNALNPSNKAQNLALAFKTAESLGIPPLLDVEDIVDIPRPEPLSIITYLSQFYHFFNSQGRGSGLATISVNTDNNSANSGGGGTAQAADRKRRMEQEEEEKRKKQQQQQQSSSIEKCFKCGKALEGPVVEVIDKSYHQECFGCHTCGRKLTTKCLNVEGFPYCEGCGRAAFIQSRKSKNTSSSTPTPSTSSDQMKDQQQEVQLKREKEEIERRRKEEEAKVLREMEEHRRKELEQKKKQAQEFERLKKKEEEMRILQMEKEKEQQRERERQQLQKEMEAREYQAREREQKERELREKEAKERQEREEKEKELKIERLRAETERMTREQKEREEKARKEREEKERREREEKQRRELEEQARRAREKRESEEKERREREEKERQRKEQEQREKEKSAQQTAPPPTKSAQSKSFIGESAQEQQHTSTSPPATATTTTAQETSTRPSAGTTNKKPPPALPYKPVSQRFTSAPDLNNVEPSTLPAKSTSSHSFLGAPEMQEPHSVPHEIPDHYNKPLPLPQQHSPKNPATTPTQPENSPSPPSSPRDGPEVVGVRMSFRRTMEREQPLNNAELPNLEGSLEKRGDVGVIKSWKRRYFRLRTDQLIYYADMQAKERDNPIGYIPLRTAYKFELEKKNPGQFQVTTADPERVWLLKAENEEEANKWLNAIVLHSKYSSLPTESDSSAQASFNLKSLKKQRREGYLEKMHGGIGGKVVTLRRGGLQWRPRWFVLKDGILFKYDTKTDTKPSGKLPLYHCSLSEYETQPSSLGSLRDILGAPQQQATADKETVCLQFQVTTNQDSWVLKASSEEEMHTWLNAILQQKLLMEQLINGIEL